MWVIALAFFVGTLIGMTGTGSGVVLTPLLLILTPYPALTIIGTDVVIGTLTRLLGVLEHKRLKQVRWRLGVFLIGGSVPGTVAGGVLVHWMKSHLAAPQIDHALKTVLAILLITVAVFLPIARSRESNLRHTLVEPRTPFEGFKLLATGALVGLLVAVTSIGSGSLMMIFLLLLTPFRAAEMVGTDILYGVGTGAMASSIHLWMGNLDTGLFLRLLAGTLPGVIVGSRLTVRISERYLTWLFTALYFALGARLLMAL
jgi:uncharacterized membrane protein YfcA